MAKMHNIIDAPDLQEGQKHTLAHNAVVFGDTMSSGFGWPYKDTPMYLKKLDDFEEKLAGNNTCSSNKSKNAIFRRLVQLLRLKAIRGSTKDEKKLDDFEEKLGGNNTCSSNQLKNVILRQLVQLLRLEVTRGSTEDGTLYATLLSEEDIKYIATDRKFGQRLSDWQIRSGLSLEELALIQPTYEFVARKARNKFDELMAKMHNIIDAPDLQEGQKHTLAHNAVVFGDTMSSGFGWPYKDTPMYLKKLDDFEEKLAGNNTCSSNKSKNAIFRRLVQLLRLKAIRGSTKDEKKLDDFEEKLGGNNTCSSNQLKNVILRQLVQLLRLEVIRGSTKDEALYATLLSEEDFKYMKATIVSNRRVPHY